MSPLTLTMTATACLLAGAAVFLAARLLPGAWDALSARQVADLSPRLRELTMNADRLPVYLRLWGSAMLATFVVVGLLLGMPLLAVPAVALVYVLPRLILHYLIGRRQTLLRDQVAGAAVLLANSTRASLTLAQGIESAGREAPEPLALELRRIALEYQRGRPLSEALRDAQRRLNLDGFTLLASALLTCLDRGSNVSEALERISKSLLEHQRLERKLDADTASGRRVVLLLGAFPVLFLGFFSLLDPVAIARLFDGVLGQLVLVVVGLLVYVGVRWALRIMRLEV